jgi:hypothetical protein
MVGVPEIGTKNRNSQPRVVVAVAVVVAVGNLSVVAVAVARLMELQWSGSEIVVAKLRVLVVMWRWWQGPSECGGSGGGKGGGLVVDWWWQGQGR